MAAKTVMSPTLSTSSKLVAGGVEAWKLATESELFFGGFMDRTS
jgi:hypothetical protein